MRVAWDLQAITGPGRTGLGVSVQFMLDALRNHADDVEAVGFRPNDANMPLSSVPERLYWEQWRLPLALRGEHRHRRLDLAYSPALGAPRFSPVPVVAHVHDLIPLYYPEQFSGVAGWYWRRVLPASWRRCRALTVSNASVADDIAEYLNYPRERIHVVPYYADPAVARAAADIKPDYAEIAEESVFELPSFVTLATHEPRKNIELAIEALGRLKRDKIHAKLICIGGTTRHTDQLRKKTWEWHVTEEVEFPGYLDRYEVAEHLLKCVALLFVSHYEGYGMPPQEAQSIGTAVVLSDIPCHRAVYGDADRWQRLPDELRALTPFIDPGDGESLAALMLRLIEDRPYRTRLRRAGLAYSETFSPQETARALTSAWRAALS